MEVDVGVLGEPCFLLEVLCEIIKGFFFLILILVSIRKLIPYARLQLSSELASFDFLDDHESKQLLYRSYTWTHTHIYSALNPEAYQT